jgi:hypothetical protein
MRFLSVGGLKNWTTIRFLRDRAYTSSGTTASPQLAEFDPYMRAEKRVVNMWPKNILEETLLDIQRWRPKF